MLGVKAAQCLRHLGPAHMPSHLPGWLETRQGEENVFSSSLLHGRLSGMGWKVMGNMKGYRQRCAFWQAGILPAPPAPSAQAVQRRVPRHAWQVPALLHPSRPRPPCPHTMSARPSPATRESRGRGSEATCREQAASPASGRWSSKLLPFWQEYACQQGLAACLPPHAESLKASRA